MKIDAETLKKQVILHPKAVRTVRRLCPCVSEYVAGGGNGLADRFMRCSHYAAGSLS